jgi:hypothetical protein
MATVFKGYLLPGGGDEVVYHIDQPLFDSGAPPYDGPGGSYDASQEFQITGKTTLGLHDWGNSGDGLSSYYIVAYSSGVAANAAWNFTGDDGQYNGGNGSSIVLGDFSATDPATGTLVPTVTLAIVANGDGTATGTMSAALATDTSQDALAFADRIAATLTIGGQTVTISSYGAGLATFKITGDSGPINSGDSWGITFDGQEFWGNSYGPMAPQSGTVTSSSTTFSWTASGGATGGGAATWTYTAHSTPSLAGGGTGYAGRVDPQIKRFTWNASGGAIGGGRPGGRCRRRFRTSQMKRMRRWKAGFYWK